MRANQSSINKITVVLFFIILFLISVSQLLLPDKEISQAERRRLEQMPKVTSNAIMERELTDKLEKYLLDQFPARDQFLKSDAFVKQVVFQRQDIGGVYQYKTYLSKVLFPEKTNDIAYITNKINTICETYLSGMPIFMTMVPDKGYFTADRSGKPHIDYDAFESELKSKLNPSLKYVSLLDSLHLEDYYKTDAHWRQEALEPVVKVLNKEMSNPTTENSIVYDNLGEFKGVYYDKLFNTTEPDQLITVKVPGWETAIVTYADEKKEAAIYRLDMLDHLDRYDTFLGGPQSLVYIENEAAQTDKELVMFRDSFGSSIAPWFIQTYKKITLIDLRYVDVDKLNQYVSFSNQDILFLYNTTVLNNKINFK